MCERNLIHLEVPYTKFCVCEVITRCEEADLPTGNVSHNHSMFAGTTRILYNDNLYKLQLLTNFIDIPGLGQAAVADLSVRRIPSDRRLHFNIATLCAFGHQEGRVLDRGVRVFRAVEGTGAGVVRCAFPQVWITQTEEQV